jgi:membrane-associated phospholipid phosphatase
MTAHPKRREPSNAGATGTAPADDVARPRKSAPILLVAGFGVLAACLFLFGVLAEGIRDGEVFLMDTLATPFFHALASPGMDALMNLFTLLGSVFVIPILYAITMGVLVLQRRYGAALFLTVSSGGALLLNGAMKLFFERPRPQVPWASVLPDYSFPSGHTMNSVAFYGALAVIIWSIAGRRWGIVAVVSAAVLCTLIGISRIYLGYHYFTDVIGGALAGVSWLLITMAVFRVRPLADWWTSPSHRS